MIELSELNKNNMALNHQKISSKTIKTFLILGLCTLLAWPLLLFFSIMLQGGPHVDPINQLLITLFFIYPIPVIVGSILGLVKWSEKKQEKLKIIGLAIMYIPLLFIFLLFIASVLILGK